MFVKVESNKNSLGKEQYLNEGEYKFIFLLGTTYGVLSMGDDETFLAVFVDRKSMPLKIFFISQIFKQRALAHKANQCFPLRRAYLFTFMQFLFFLDSPSSLIKAPTRGHYGHACALGELIYGYVI